MTDNEIIKALECCITNDCAKCKAYDETYGEIVDCLHTICRNALDLINRQKAEIERLKVATEEVVSCFHRMESLYNIKCMELKVAKAEAVKEFAERLKEQYDIWEDDEYFFEYVTTDQIDNLLKEMVGD